MVIHLFIMSSGMEHANKRAPPNSVFFVSFTKVNYLFDSIYYLTFAKIVLHYCKNIP